MLWDASKDRSLWKILSKTPKNSDVNWHALADSYAVSLPFLLQQAAYLYDRQFSQVRAQLRRVGASKSSVAPLSATPGTESTGGEAMVRTVSGGGPPRAPSALSVRRDSPAPNADGSLQKPPLAARAAAPSLSRTSSTSTTVPPPSRPTLPTSPLLGKAQFTRRPTSPRRPSTTVGSTAQPLLSPSPSTSSTSSASSASDDDLPAQSRMLRRPPRRARSDADDEDDDDDDGAPTFLPFAGTPQPAAAHDQSAGPRRKNPADPARRSHTSDSSGSSSAPRHPASHRDARRGGVGAGGAIPGRRTAELQSPARRGAGPSARGGSDGTPSMGSSFSDLDGESALFFSRGLDGGC